MRVGKMRHRIQIYLPAEMQDDAGSLIQGAPVRVLEAWASIEPLRGREFETAQAMQVQISHRIRMRYQPGIVEKMVVAYGNQRFDIQEAININFAMKNCT